jgi:hypothetical protein
LLQESVLKAVATIELELELRIELKLELKLRLKLARKTKVFVSIVDTKVLWRDKMDVTSECTIVKTIE